MKTKKGMPIFLDETDRPIVDPLHSDTNAQTFRPANKPAKKLYQCIESMRDLLVLLKNIPTSKAVDKQRRKTKAIFTPLYSFVIALQSLMHDIQNNPDTKNHLPEGTDIIVDTMDRRFASIIPHGKSELLRVIRNRMSAHIDVDLDPAEAQALFSQATTPEIGLWLHTCVAVLCDLLKLPIYLWSCATSKPNEFGLTTPTEPIMMTFEIGDVRPKQITGCFIIRDPRTDVFNMAKDLVNASEWMFGPNDRRIRGFKEDGPNEPWAQSLETLLSPKQ